MEVKNKNLKETFIFENDFYYHLGIAPNSQTKETFKDVKFVCLGGKQSRMKKFAEYLHEEVLGRPQNSVFQKGTNKLCNISEQAGRYSMYKTGCCISVSHGMGMPSLSILMHELFKMLTFAECSKVTFVRLGTSGGIGLEAGTIVITKQSYSSQLEPYYTQVVCGKQQRIESSCDPCLAQRLLEIGSELDLKTEIGNTMSCDGFYEEQGRMDGALCGFTKAEKMVFLEKAHNECGIKNIEMESCAFAALCHRYQVKCATVCVALLDRLKTDHINAAEVTGHELNLFRIIGKMISSSTTSEN